MRQFTRSFDFPHFIGENARALGAHADPVVLSTLEFSVSGAMLQAGMGHLSYDDLPGELSRIAGLVVR